MPSSPSGASRVKASSSRGAPSPQSSPKEHSILASTWPPFQIYSPMARAHTSTEQRRQFQPSPRVEPVSARQRDKPAQDSRGARANVSSRSTQERIRSDGRNSRGGEKVSDKKGSAGKMEKQDRPPRKLGGIIPSHQREYASSGRMSRCSTGVPSAASSEAARNMPPLPEHEFDTIKEHVGTSIGAKFKTTRAAFRDYDEDKSGSIDRREVRRLFRTQGYSQDAADRFFNTMDTDRSGALDTDEFRSVFCPYISPGYEKDDFKGIQTTSQLYYNNHILSAHQAQGISDRQWH